MPLHAAGGQAGPGVLGLDAVPQPVRAPRRARLIPQRLGQPGGVIVLRAGGGLVAVAHLLGEVLGQVADAPGRVRGPGEHALGVEPFPEPGHVPGQVIAADGIQGLIPGRQHLAGGRVDVPAHLVVPDGQLVAVAVLDRDVGPPDLVVGRGEDPAQLGPGDGAPQGDVDVRGEAALGFDGGEVLHVVAEVAAQVLDEPVEQRREGQRVPGGLVVVVPGRVDRARPGGRPGRRTGRSA